METLLVNVLNALKVVLTGGVVLGSLVFVHELGHFIAAKLCGIRVLAFSLGFGKVVIRKSIGTTEYRISLIPVGGYVHMAGEHPEDDTSGQPDEFTSKPIWQRAVVALGGPVANYVFALLALWIMFLPGEEQPLYLDSTVAGAAVKGSPAESAGILPGDRILTVNGNNVSTWDDVQEAFSDQAKTYRLSAERDTAVLTLTLRSAGTDKSGLPKHSAGGLLPSAPALVGSVRSGSPADLAGFAAGDSIMTIDGRHIHSWFELSELITGFDTSAGTMSFTLWRDDSSVSLAATPEYNDEAERFLIGVGMDEGPTRRISYTPSSALVKAFEQSGAYAAMIFVVVKKLATGQVSPKQLAGPVGIVQMSGTVALLQGIIAILNLFALVGINLAVLNLLPLIITDGGMLLFLLLEAIRGRPLSLKHQILLNRIAIAFFVTLFLYVTLNDINRIPELFRLLTTR